MYSNKVLDHGTPARESTTTVTVTIDGKAVHVPAGTSVMRAAVDAGVKIPKLCATDSLDAFGSCRLCVVEVEGRRGYPARSCRRWRCAGRRRARVDPGASDRPANSPTTAGPKRGEGFAWN